MLSSRIDLQVSAMSLIAEFAKITNTQIGITYTLAWKNIDFKFIILHFENRFKNNALLLLSLGNLKLRFIAIYAFNYLLLYYN